MKGIILLTMMMICLLPVRADILSDIINGKYEETEDISYEEPSEDHDLDNGEIYHWDDIYLCTYFYDTEVILDPYGSNDEVGFYD
jgi:hypothetical protein